MVMMSTSCNSGCFTTAETACGKKRDRLAASSWRSWTTWRLLQNRPARRTRYMKLGHKPLEEGGNSIRPAGSYITAASSAHGVQLVISQFLKFCQMSVASDYSSSIARSAEIILQGLRPILGGRYSWQQ